YFNPTAPAAINTLYLHDALPIYPRQSSPQARRQRAADEGAGSPSQAAKALQPDRAIDSTRSRAGDARRVGIRASPGDARTQRPGDRKSTRLNSSHVSISYAVFCL